MILDKYRIDGTIALITGGSRGIGYPRAARLMEKLEEEGFGREPTE
jgi:NAD(P)-dependent dehydrogenase (short-subunit alcohol dehydrogenase family)